MTADHRSPAEIEAEIEAERSRLSRDLDELQERLTVENVVDDVKAQVRVQINEIQRALRGQLLEVTGTVGSEMRTQLTRTSTGVVRLTRENPWPMLVTGLGLAWLTASALRRPPAPKPAYAPVQRGWVREEAQYDASPADMAAAQLEEEAGSWAREVVDAKSSPVPPYHARPSWAREDY
ncbi:DUF3618 domain-containing protein [Salipiger sp. IMCC34102]|uniref:DUF3618 domain-containing protein n=1 Tax=Salipiger sp. IMCC34102 TaxID=2510647 RepID=UPI00101CDCD9|nr:DUF3618 domain-containing protein [Salipiger sp. IMCC34102]RYH03942.1 DUF3618 domain-containing protein [Salipiger sp. IMCC34102]